MESSLHLQRCSSGLTARSISDRVGPERVHAYIHVYSYCTRLNVSSASQRVETRVLVCVCVLYKV